MTEYEVADIAESTASSFLATFTIFISLVTTYIIAAFVAGTRLSKFRVTVVNLSFLTSTSLIGFLSIQMFQRATVLVQRTTDQIETPVAPFDFSWAIVALYTGLLAGSVVFMVSIRRNKNNADA